MGLLELINKDESLLYISLKEAINLLKEKTDSTIQEVAIYLLNKDVPKELSCHTRCSDYKIKETSGKSFDYGMLRPYGKNWAFEYLTNISIRHNCENWDELNSYSAGHWNNWEVIFKDRNIGLLENTYWYREAFFNLEPIKALNLFEEEVFESNRNLYPIWDAEYLNLQVDRFSDLEEKDIYPYMNESENLQFESEQKQFTSKEVPLFYANDSFTLIEASCLISGDNPININRCINDVDFDEKFLGFSEAYSFISSAINAGILPKNAIKADHLKAYLKKKGKVIIGFNDNCLSQSDTYENFDKKSILKLNFSNELDSSFIRIFTAVEFFKCMTSLSYNEIIIHIRKIFNNLTLYTLDENLVPVTGYDFCDGACINYLVNFLESAHESIHMLNAARSSVEEYFWEKNEFFSNETVISFGLSKNNYNLFLIASLVNPDDDYIFLNNSDINVLQKIINNKAQDFNSYMQVEFNKLKNNNNLERSERENENLKSKIQELIAQQNNIQTTVQEAKTGLLSLIFDESATDRYAPDLVLSIKLWKAIYIDNPKNDSHSNKANNWISLNTDYELTRPSATKLREITNPLVNWSTHRDRNYKK